VVDIVSLRVVLFRVLARREASNENPEALVNLRRRETNPLILLHRCQHVIDELLDLWRSDLRRMQRPGFRAQHRMPHARDLQDGHMRIIWWLAVGEFVEIGYKRGIAREP